MASAVSTESKADLASETAGFRTARDGFNLEFEDVLKNDHYRTALSKFLQATHADSVKLLDFLQEVDTLHRAFVKIGERNNIMEDPAKNPAPETEVLMTPSAAVEEDQKTSSEKRRTSVVENDTETLRSSARAILGKFFSDSQPDSNLTSAVPAELLKSARSAIQGWPAAIKLDRAQASKAQLEVVQVFDHLERHVREHMDREFYPRFVNSEFYVDMMLERMDAEDDIGIGTAADTMSKLTSTAQSAGGGWVNEAGYQSIHVDVVEARRLRDGTFGRHADAYCVATVDTTSYKTKVISSATPNWSENGDKWCHFEFPLRNTTTHVMLNLFDHQLMRADKHLGKVEVAVADLVHEQQQLELKEKEAAAGKHKASVTHRATVADLSQVEAEIKVKIGTPWYVIRKDVDETVDAPKARGEVRCRVFVSKMPPRSTGHKELQYDASSVLADVIRQKVSKKKRRFQRDGFDLDLTYITDRVIAMGFPSQKLEGVYRNSMATVKIFFDKRHKDHYRVYNLCSERFYDPEKFHGNVVRFPFDDHNPCPFGMLEAFCRDVHKWLAQHPQNIAAIHCKAGKGRTGLMIGAYMLYTQLFHTAASALKFYGVRRTHNAKGVTIPSQIRYVHYFDRFLRYARMIARAEDRIKSMAGRTGADLVKSGDADVLSDLNVMEEKKDTGVQKVQTIRAAAILGFKNRKMSVMERADVYDYLQLRNDRIDHKSLDSASKAGSYFLPDEDKHAVFLSKIVIHHVPKEVGNKTGGVFFKVTNADRQLEYVSNKGANAVKGVLNEKENTLTFELPAGSVEVFGDLQTIFYNTTTFGKSKLFQYWLNTRFLVADDCHVVLTKPEVDKINKDHKNKDASPNFKVEVFVALAQDRPNEELYSTLYKIQKSHDDFKSIIGEELGGRVRVASVTSSTAQRPPAALAAVSEEEAPAAATGKKEDSVYEDLSDNDDEDDAAAQKQEQSDKDE